MKNVIAEKTAGTVTKMGTDWPVNVELIQWDDDSTWTVQARCNGSDYGCQDFGADEAEAREYYENFEFEMAQ